MPVNTLSTLKIAAAAALMLAPALLSSPASADTDTQPKAAHHATHRARANVRNSYASVPSSTPFTIGDESGFAGNSYHCGIGLYNTPLPCEPNN